MSIIITKYQDGYDFPLRDIDPKKKDEAYCQKWAKAIYGRYVANKTAWPYKTSDWWEEMRAYSQGQQSSEKYKSWLFADLESDGQTVDTYDDTPLGRVAKREGWYNMLWDTVSPAPKIMNSIHGMFDDIEYNLFVDVTDAKSKDLQETEKWRKIVEGQFADWQAEYKRKAGIPIDEPGPLPKSEEEFDVIAAGEGFKIGIAKAMQKIIRVAIDQDSEWVDVIKKKLIDDLLTIGKIATRDYYDEEEKRFKAKYVDPVSLVVQWSREFDYNDSEYAGIFVPWTISNLKKKLPHITEDEWRTIAKLYADQYGNGKYDPDWDTVNGFDNTSGLYRYDRFKVCVFEAEWIDYDTYKGLEYKSVHGRKTYHRIGFDTEVKPLTDKQTARGAEQKVTKSIKRQLYECNWVVGTDYSFESGPVQMAPRDADYRPTLRVKVEQLGQKSLTEQLFPVYDQFMIAWLRYQNSMAYMVERGYAVNMGMLMNITDGTGKKMSWKDALQMMKQTGFLPFMTSIPGNYQGGAISPIVPIEGGIGARLDESVKTFEWCFWMIENITGLNPIALGSTPQKDTPVTTTMQSLQGTSNTLKPIITALMEVKKNTATNILRRIQVGIRNDKKIRESYTGVIGSADMEALIAAERDLAKYGLSLNFRPDFAFKEKLREYIKLCLSPGRNGVPSLNPDDAMYFEERLDQGGDLIEIRQQIKYTIEKNNQRAFAEQQANIQAQNEGLRRIEQEKSQKEVAMKQMDAELEAMKSNLSTANQMRLDRLESNNSLFEELAKQGPGMWQAAMDAVSTMRDMSEADLPIILARMNRNRGVQPPQNLPSEPRSPSGGTQIPPTGR